MTQCVAARSPLTFHLSPFTSYLSPFTFHLMNLDERLFLWLNGLHADWLDPMMVAATDIRTWIPLYLLLLFLVFKHYRWRGFWVILGLALVVLCSDQLSAHVCKPLFHRLRPCHNPELEGLIHLPNGMAGGKYGFVSSHAANTFAVATFITAALRGRYRWVGWLVFGWAIISSYSRIYLGVHYPGDILAGAALGAIIGLIIWKLLRLILKNHLNC